MSTEAIVNYQILFGGNYSELFGNMGKVSATITAVTSYIRDLSQSFDQALQPGINFDSEMKELSAITGVVGEGLDVIGKNAREAAKAFGLDAGQAVRSYSLLLSQLSPEIANNSEALDAMGTNVAILSKSMRGDTTAAAEVLTTAMNQFGVSLDDPILASQTMANMMNVMAAAANAGSAELPQIKAALEQVGMTAKAAGVSFEETNAAIQVLDKAGRKGSEGGVALRNVMTTLAQGRFLPEEVQKELVSAGININDLTDNSMSLSSRLETLKPILNDSALLTKLFGKESVASAMALINGTGAIDGYTNAISGTTDAVDFANIVMESYEEKQARVKAKFDDLKISIFNLTGDTGIWVGLLTQSLVPIAQVIPLIGGVGKMFTLIKGIKFGDVMSNVSRSFTGARIQLSFMNQDLRSGQMESLGFLRNILRAALGVVRFATVGLWSAIKGIGAFIVSLVTGGATSVKFAAISSASFATFATTASAACKAVTVAIGSIPIIGRIAIIITAVTGLFIWLYNKFDRFRATVNGIWAWFKALFTSENAGEAFDKAYNKTMEEAKKKKEEEKKKDGTTDFDAEMKRIQDEINKSNNETEKTKGLNINSNINNTASTAAGDKKIKNINITIDRVIEHFTVSTTNLKESTERIKDIVAEAIIEGINDVNLSF